MLGSKASSTDPNLTSALDTLNTDASYLTTAVKEIAGECFSPWTLMGTLTTLSLTSATVVGMLTIVVVGTSRSSNCSSTGRQEGRGRPLCCRVRREAWLLPWTDCT